MHIEILTFTYYHSFQIDFNVYFHDKVHSITKSDTVNAFLTKHYMLIIHGNLYCVIGKQNILIK